MKNLRKIREMLGLTQADLAKRSGLTPAAISNFEAGTREPSLSSVIAILKAIPMNFKKPTIMKESSK